MRRFDELVSLGHTCGTKYQIALNGFRREHPDADTSGFEPLLRSRTALFSRGRKSHFFDWIVSPFPSVVRLIDSDFEGVFQRRSLIVTGRGNVVRDGASDLYFFHEFHRAGDALTAREVDQQYPRQRAKLRHLRDKFRALLRSEARVLYVLGLPDGHPLDALPAFHETMARRHPRHRYVLLCVRHSSAPSVTRRKVIVRREEAREIFCEVTCAVDKPPADQWSFNDEVWQSVLDRYGWRAARTS